MKPISIWNVWCLWLSLVFSSWTPLIMFDGWKVVGGWQECKTWPDKQYSCDPSPAWLRWSTSLLLHIQSLTLTRLRLVPSQTMTLLLPIFVTPWILVEQHVRTGGLISGIWKRRKFLVGTHSHPEWVLQAPTGWVIREGRPFQIDLEILTEKQNVGCGKNESVSVVWVLIQTNSHRHQSGLLGLITSHAGGSMRRPNGQRCC